jgi:peptidyl-tRNA hydrolase, PTH1 family
MMRLFRRRESEEADDAEGLHMVVGLGNPGAKYEHTRHNIGFVVIERFAERHSLVFKGSKHHADIARGTVAGTPVVLAMPLTFMNESGFAVRRLLSYYKVPPANLLVVCDDLDLPFGRLRIRTEGSSGGNGGLKSIIQELGTESFVRLRVGIDRPTGHGRVYVLQKFPPEQERVLTALSDIACDAIETILSEGADVAMNRFNRDWLSELS